MPQYQFQTEDGEIVELTMSFSDFDNRVRDGHITLDDGRVATSFFGNWGASKRHRSVATCPGNYPMVSYAAGVHPSQIAEQQAVLKAEGVRNTHFTKDGDPVFEDRSHRREYCEALGLFDRNGGYSDPAPRHRTANVRKYR